MQLYKDFIPINSISYIEDLLNLYQIEIKIKSERKTRHGDFRVLSNGNCLITVNSNLNKYRFLITLIHELAHFRVNQNSKKRIRPHGIEWKKIFQSMMLPFLNNIIFPDEILSRLAHYLKNPSATTDSDIDLVISLSKYDLEENDNMFLFDISNEDLFQYNEKKIYKKIGKLRKRYICEEIATNKKYLFSPVARVKKIKYEKSSS